MRRLLREPLLHFLALGAAIFLFLGRGDGPEDAAGVREPIVVTRARVESLVEAFAKTWQRPPSAAEIEGLVRDHVAEEACVREALELGLDRDDVIVRRRLRQKLEFLFEDAATLGEPTDAELQAWVDAHPESFRTEDRWSFRQVHLDPAKRGGDLDRDAAEILGRLKASGAGVDLQAIGDSRLLEPAFEDIGAGEVAARFGASFAAALAGLPVGEWRGPVPSGHGVHLVCVTRHAAGRLPGLAEARDAVRRDLESARRREATARFHESLRAKYAVIVEEAPPVSAGAGTEAGR